MGALLRVRNLILLFLVICLIHTTRRKWQQYCISRQHGCQPPIHLPARDPIFGLDHLASTLRPIKSHTVLVRSEPRFAQYGHTHQSRRLFTTILATREPRNIKAILSTNVYDYSLNRLTAYGPLLGTGIFTTDGPAWSQSRALPRPTFAKSQIADLATFEALITELLVLLPTDGRPIDLQELFFGYAIDSATTFLLGRCSHPLRRLGSPASAAASHHDVDFASAFDDAQAAIRTRERLGVLRMSHRDKHADECFQICHGFVEKAIDDAVRSVRVPRASTTPTAGGKETGRQPPFIDTLLEQTSNRSLRRDELMNLLAVGRDTTASLLSNLFSMLARHPDTVVAGWGVGWFERVRLWFLVWSGFLVR